MTANENPTPPRRRSTSLDTTMMPIYAAAITLCTTLQMQYAASVFLGLLYVCRSGRDNSLNSTPIKERYLEHLLYHLCDMCADVSSSAVSPYYFSPCAPNYISCIIDDNVLATVSIGAAHPSRLLTGVLHLLYQQSGSKLTVHVA